MGRRIGGTAGNWTRRLAGGARMLPCLLLPNADTVNLDHEQLAAVMLHPRLEL